MEDYQLITFSNLDEDDFLEKGYWIRPCENKEFFDDMCNKVKVLIEKDFPQTRGLSLAELHKVISKTEVNDLRMKIFGEMNEDKDFRYNYLSLGRSYIEHLCGTELSANTKVNFSIQLPHDTSSILPSHCDTFSGESSYQINLWVPLTESFQSNSMHIFRPIPTKNIITQMKLYETKGLDTIFDDYKAGTDYEELYVAKGNLVVFTPTALHGNRLNTTDKTRISFNCRFKNLHSPHNAPVGSSKILGQFYSPIRECLATKIGRNRALDILAEQRK